MIKVIQELITIPVILLALPIMWRLFSFLDPRDMGISGDCKHCGDPNHPDPIDPDD
ncbi:MAG: hypothetical protein INQ03_25445 [Candidatus Heimdallarchaeota archaeon]|nr:hypothetical protein [Candidatus Heimdallarchaeota archaeon]